MRETLIAVGVAITVASGCAPAPTNVTTAVSVAPQSVADDLVAADKAFAAAAANRTAIEAVSAMIDKDVVMFIVPQPVQARGEAQARELLAKAFAGEASTLSWAPVRAGVSADGTQGFTYGFATRTIAGKEPALSKYVSYWVKRPEGWRLAAYKLVPRPAGSVATALRAAALPDVIVTPTTDAALIDRYRADLDATERAFSNDSQVIGIGPAFVKYGSPDAMNVSGEADFTYGNEAIGGGFGTEATSPLSWKPDGVLVASSGDLGITYGYLERNGPVPAGRLARIPWFTVWRRASPQQPWRYVAE